MPTAAPDPSPPAPAEVCPPGEESPGAPSGPGRGARPGEAFIAGSFPSRRNSLIGLDIGLNSLKLVQVYPVSGGWEIGGVAVQPIRLDPDQEGLDDRELLTGTLKELLGRLRIRHFAYACSLRGENCSTTLIPLARMPRKELEGASRLEVKRRVAFDVEKAIIRNTLVEDQGGRPGAKLNYLVTVARREAVKRRLAAAQGAGLLLNSLVPMPWAWKKLIEISDPGPGAVMIVDIGSNRTQVNVYRDSRLKFSREFALGGDAATSEIIQAGKCFGGEIEISWEEAETVKRSRNLIGNAGAEPLRGKLTVAQAGSMLRPVLERIVQECRRSLEYYDQLFRDGKISRIYLTGGGALLPGFFSFFQERMSAPVELMLPPERLRLHPSIQDREGVIRRFPDLSRAAALGLSAKPPLNFISPPVLFIQNLLRSKAALLILAVFLFGLSLILYRLKISQIPQFEDLIRSRKEGVAVLEKELSPYAQLEALKQEVAGTGKLGVYSQERRPDWRGILKELSRITPPEVVLISISLASSPDRAEQEMVVNGEAVRIPGSSASPVTEFVARMENSPFFRDVQEIRENSRTGTFSFSCTLDF